MDERHNDSEPLVIPHDQPANPTQQPVADDPTPSPTPQASLNVQAGTPPEPQPTAATPPVEPPSQPDGWFRMEEQSQVYAPPLPAENLNWTASEFIAHDKSTRWYATLAVAAVVGIALMYLITRDIVSTVVVLFAAVMFGILAARKPRTQRYSLTAQGLQIGQKFYQFGDFKTFSVSEDGAIASIILSPLKRFMPPLTIYVAPDLEDNVVTFLSAYLPFEQHKADAVDSLLKRIRF